MNSGVAPEAAAVAKVTEDDRVLAGGMFEAYRAKLTELNAGKAMGGNPMPPWEEVAAKGPDEPGGHVAACWVQAAEFARAHLARPTADGSGRRSGGAVRHVPGRARWPRPEQQPMSHALNPPGPWVSLPVLYPAEFAAIEDQPPPLPNDRPAVWDLVIADMRERDAVGRERYGTPLQPFNGRDALVDAYQESLDKTAYLRQAIEERREIAASTLAAGEALAQLRRIAPAHLLHYAEDFERQSEGRPEVKTRLALRLAALLRALAAEDT